MKRRDFEKSSICLGCASACGISLPFVNAEGLIFTPEEELAMQKFVYKSVDELPKNVRLDICNLCQLNCPACWMRLDEEKILKDYTGFGYVSFECFKSFLNENPFIEQIEVANHGEIFLNPDFDRIVKYAYKKNVTLTAFNGANLNKLSEETAENLVKYKFKYLVISIDGASPETYAIYRRGGDFDTVIKNIELINKYKEKYKSKYPVLIYKFILFGHNEHEIEQAKELAQKLRMQIKYEVNCAKGYSPLKDKERALRLTGLSSLESVDKDYLINYKTGKSDWYFCSLLFDNPQINYNGNLFGCCIYNKDFGVNVFKEGLLNALNNKNVLYAKLMLTDFNYGKKYGIPCSNCDKYNFLKGENYPIRYHKG